MGGAGAALGREALGREALGHEALGHEALVVSGVKLGLWFTVKWTSVFERITLFMFVATMLSLHAMLQCYASILCYNATLQCSAKTLPYKCYPTMLL